MQRSVLLFGFLGLLLVIPKCEGVGLWCYACYYGQPGCGDEVDWEVQRERSEWCEEQCVKFVDDSGSARKVYRGCLTTMMKKTYFREKMPGLRRHGYCLPARSHVSANKFKDPLAFVLEPKQHFCFCDEYIFCNTGNQLKANYRWSLLTLVALISGLLFSNVLL